MALVDSDYRFIFVDTGSQGRISDGGVLRNSKVFKKPLSLEPEKASVKPKTCVLLHNFLQRSRTSAEIYMTSGIVDNYDLNGTLVQPGTWRNVVDESCAIRAINQIPRRSSINAIQIREEYVSYFINNPLY
ncbi:unnamed protein product [Euphydryas editha]|uniref:Uncharacterized protein n=1 Tax=Euphydryas editha TaxID=104508 RepID=A0AAU9URX7_EUPED|nr:unnamed protein product [Euphydryas editha]